MGRVTAAIAVTALLSGFATARLPPPAWLVSLYGTLVLLFLLVLCVIGWAAKVYLGRSGGQVSWALAPVLVSAPLVALSFVVSKGPGMLPPVESMTVDLGSWAASAGGLAGSLALIGFGAVLVHTAGGRSSLLGACLLLVGMALPQPALRAAGLPNLGPLAIFVGLVAVVAMYGRRFWFSNRKSAQPGRGPPP